jgi:hypothetical protein
MKHCSYCFSDTHDIDDCSQAQYHIYELHKAIHLLLLLIKRRKIEWVAPGYPHLEDWLCPFIEQQYSYAMIKQMYHRIRRSVPDHMHIHRNPNRSPFEMRTPQRYTAVLQYYWRTKRTQPDDWITPVPTETEVPIPMEGLFRILDPVLTFQDGILRYGTPLPSAPPLQGEIHPPVRHTHTVREPAGHTVREPPQLITLSVPEWVRAAQQPSAPPLPKVRLSYTPALTYNEPTCSICLTAEPYYQTQCGHDFCSCLFQHMIEYGKQSCPMCRTNLTSVRTTSEPCYQSLRMVGSQHFMFE